ncbi:GNAT family N-acetyltransferase [Streptomyces sp. SID5474]|nr:GNAT family N-acetyltransferase [Embleya scabrispora]MYS78753.1 GNAT family N-acetyltransferase [Streptomyces sp. SID5474]
MATIRRVTTVADVIAAGDLFDDPVRPDWAARFLGEAGHHILLAYVGATPVGMVTGVETTHPDKGTEMFLYELAVADDHRRHGIGRALTEALAELARKRGCYGMWVLTERDNEAALATYRAAAADTESDHAMFAWTFDT